jgi:hypothetical protein
MVVPAVHLLHVGCCCCCGHGSSHEMFTVKMGTQVHSDVDEGDSEAQSTACGHRCASNLLCQLV